MPNFEIISNTDGCIVRHGWRDRDNGIGPTRLRPPLPPDADEHSIIQQLVVKPDGSVVLHDVWLTKKEILHIYQRVKDGPPDLSA